MDPINAVNPYRISVQELLNQYLEERPADPNVETQLIADVTQE